jgi:putative oxidoreductase
MPDTFEYSPSLTRGAAFFTAVGLAAAIYAAGIGEPTDMPAIAKAFMILWLMLSLGATLVLAPRNFVLGYLTGLFALLVGWRIAGIYDVGLVSYPLIGAFVSFVLQFFECARNDLASKRGGPNAAGVRLSVAEWHMTFIRLYVGLDFVLHFTEKLFAGSGPHMADVEAFERLGLAAPDFMVWLAGLCELGAAIGIGLGLFTRLAAVGAALYILIATVLGNHFFLGFIWAASGGGWEYPVMWTVLLLSFAFAGAGRFSLDYLILQKSKPPRVLQLAMIR